MLRTKRGSTNQLTICSVEVLCARDLIYPSFVALKMEAVTNFVKEKVEEAVEGLALPVIGKKEDVDKAKEVVGDSGKVYGALKVPEDALKISPMYYLLFCVLPPALSAKRRLEKTMYIITDKGVKVHVEPYEPFMGIGNADNDNMEIALDEIKDIKIVKKSEGCMASCSSDKIVLEGPGTELYVDDVDTVGDALKKLKTFADASKAGGEKAKELMG